MELVLAWRSRIVKFQEITILDTNCDVILYVYVAIPKYFRMGWNSDLYDTKHDFVSRYGEEVLTLLQATAGEKILDLGCGTGDLAEMIHRRGALVVGIDRSEDMIRSAKDKYPHLDFRVAAAESFSYPEEFDTIFSNAALHWVLKKKHAIKCMYGALKHQGRLVVEFGREGNVESIVRSLKNALNQTGESKNAQKIVWYFPSLSEYTTLLE
jgi:trans-aconitate methyltransferase